MSAFCKNTIEGQMSGKTLIDNIFICEYLPYLSENAIKAYLYGQFLCQSGSSASNTKEDFAKSIKLSEKDLIKAFESLAAEGLVELIKNQTEFEVRFPPIRDVINNIKKFNKTKYSDFNAQIQAIIEERMIMPNEFKEYYDIMEVLNIEPEAMIMIAKHCAVIKGKSVGHPYITRVAKNFAYQGAKTAKAVGEKLLEQERSIGKIKELLLSMKIARMATMEERELYIKWKKELGFKDSAILFAQQTGYKIKSFEALDKVLTNYAFLGLKTESGIESYEKAKKEKFDIAKDVIKKLGLYYQNMEPVVDEYVAKWIGMGLKKESIISFAKTCFKNGVRTLEKFNELLINQKTVFKNQEYKTKQTIKKEEEVSRHTKILALRKSNAEFKKIDDELRKAQITNTVTKKLEDAHKKFLQDAGIV